MNSCRISLPVSLNLISTGTKSPRTHFSHQVRLLYSPVLRHDPHGSYVRYKPLNVELMTDHVIQGGSAKKTADDKAEGLKSGHISPSGYPQTRRTELSPASRESASVRKQKAKVKAALLQRTHDNLRSEARIDYTKAWSAVKPRQSCLVNYTKAKERADKLSLSARHKTGSKHTTRLVLERAKKLSTLPLEFNTVDNFKKYLKGSIRRLQGYIHEWTVQRTYQYVS